MTDSRQESTAVESASSAESGAKTIINRMCAAVIYHDPHVWQPRGHPQYFCKGYTRQQEQAAQMRLKGRRQSEWWHLVSVHHLSHLSERAYGRNTELWKQVDKAIHDAYDRGLEAGREDAK